MWRRNHKGLESVKPFGNLVKDEDEISPMFSLMGWPHMKVTSPIVKAIDQETMIILWMKNQLPV